MSRTYSNSFRYTFLWSSFELTVIGVCIFLYYLHIENKPNILDYFSHRASAMYGFQEDKGAIVISYLLISIQQLVLFLCIMFAVLIQGKKNNS